MRPSRETTPQTLRIDHPAVTADTLTKEWVNGTGRRFKVNKVNYRNPTGLVQDTTNYYIITLKQGSVVVATWSTLTGAQGTLAADTEVALTLSSTAADLIVEDGEGLSLNLDVHGSQTLPIGRMTVSGEWL